MAMQTEMRIADVSSSVQSSYRAINRLIVIQSYIVDILSFLPFVVGIRLMY